MDGVSLGSAEEPYDSDMTHSYRLTEGRLIRYPLLHQNFSTYFELSIHLTILEDGIL